jgi:colicin import membrane protein
VKRTPQEAPASEKRPAPGRIRAIILAVAVHALFIAVIVFGVTWQNAPTTPVQAELWDKLPPARTPVAQAPAPKPPPEPSEPPKPAPEPPKPAPEPPKPEPEPPKPQPPKAEPKVEAPKPDPEIALKAERQKREKAEREKAEREKAERDRREKAEREKVEREKVQKKREEQERKQREREEAEQLKREEAERQRQIQQQQAEAARARAAAASARKKEFDEWIDRIKVRIRSRANVPDTVPKGTKVQVLIRILPGGEVLDIAITKRSGNPAYDNAIERAIRSASPLPVPPPNSELFPQFRELSLNFEHEG